MSTVDGGNVTLHHLQQQINIINEKLNEIIFNNRRSKKNIGELTVENDNLYDLLYNVELQSNHLDQYSRRSNIEIRNISEKVSQRHIENYVLKVMASIGINLQSYDLVAVHRIGKFIEGKNRNVIVRFMNRKNAFVCLRNSKKLAVSSTHEYRKLFIIENLCPSNRRIFSYLYKLKKSNQIKIVWTFNGVVFFQKVDAGDDHVIKVEHFEDISYYLNQSVGSEMDS